MGAGISLERHLYRDRRTTPFQNPEGLSASRPMSRAQQGYHASRFISGWSYKTAFSNELWTSIFPL
jgi:hypothetical protein